MAGLRAGHPASERPRAELRIPRFEQIIPIWIHFLDQSDFPCAIPALDACLALNRVDIERMLFKPRQPRHAVFLNELRSPRMRSGILDVTPCRESRFSCSRRY